ncbi:MAG: ParB N-terminal domain-containing protein [Candidatus Paceibacterota bacterium]|jgi:N6-adenosine-specific RNA methylase IME4
MTEEKKGNEQGFLMVNIADIDFGDRIREEYDIEYDGLKDDIKAIGQHTPVILERTGDRYLLRDGGRRLTTLIALKKPQVKATILSAEEAKNAEYIERSAAFKRKSFTFVEMMRSIDKRRTELKQLYGERRGGKKTQPVDSEYDMKEDNLHPFTGKAAIIIAKEHGISERTYKSACTIWKNAIPEVHKAIKTGLGSSVVKKDENGKEIIDGGLSIYGALKISQLSGKKQLQALNEAVARLDSESDTLNDYNTSRRKAKRKVKNNIPTTHTPHPIFNIIRIAPDWDKTAALPDVLDLPVNDYTSDKIAVIAVECYARHLPGAMQCLDNWDFDYVTMLTVWDPKRTAGHLNFTNSDTAHIIFGMRRCSGDVGEVFRLAQIVKTAPVHARYTTSLSDSLIHIIDELFPDKADKRIDMTSDTKSKGWICWKTSYGTPKDPETEGGPNVDDPNYLPQDMPSIEPVDEPDVSVETELVEDDQPETDEADIEDFIDVVEPKKPLQIF